LLWAKQSRPKSVLESALESVPV
jgi:hypothetical protein